MAPSLAFAAGNHPMAGCGLGYIAFGHSENSKVYQVLSATVNDIVSPKTSAITSGTSGCTEDGAVRLVKKAQMYAEMNITSLRREMAIGRGEYVNTFVGLLGVKHAKRPVMVQFIQKNYKTLFPTPDTSAVEMLQSLRKQIAANPELLG